MMFDLLVQIWYNRDLKINKENGRIVEYSLSSRFVHKQFVYGLRLNAKTDRFVISVVKNLKKSIETLRIIGGERKYFYYIRQRRFFDEVKRPVAY